uniref:Protein kinase domain-containing protein n=1 Tax=Tetraselmis chuii TaxID=63592 RepID=A0A7S1X1C8_9CHLO|eukprot:CAMPEP_0177760806 /NCGR_PEP_ID=MMETSP0491_2-20121128/5465_1 /TAXON_ID=63592 /ORGANISM="Tetraselmis chuii, Strain PLY429" /LENGTH=435 /DNA_ID=CAMNT_0019276733 /DNA_START=27 /DNA_END=1334 /DNA_ORIENTATION=+
MAHPNLVQTYSYEMVSRDIAAAPRPSTSASSSNSEPTVSASAVGATHDPSLGADAILDAAAKEDELTEENVSKGGGASYQEARLIQELCDQKTLRHNLDRSTLCLPEQPLPNVGLALVLAHDIACGLEHIHSHNIIHGDLKALNVLLTSSTRRPLVPEPGLPNVIAKVTDFGLSAKLAIEQTHVSNVHSGTATHMAPEIILAGQLSKGSDIYAFGMILYELFSGRRPFEGLNMQQVVHQVTTLGRRPVFPPPVPRGVVELACVCWGPAAQRPTADAIVATLDKLVMNYRRDVLRWQSQAGGNAGVDSDGGKGLPILNAAQTGTLSLRALPPSRSPDSSWESVAMGQLPSVSEEGRGSESRPGQRVSCEKRAARGSNDISSEVDIKALQMGGASPPAVSGMLANNQRRRRNSSSRAELQHQQQALKDGGERPTSLG